VLWKLMAEVNDLKQIVAHRATRFAVSEMSLDLYLLTQLYRSVYVFGY
jgi:hypothetical protein